MDGQLMEHAFILILIELHVSKTEFSLRKKNFQLGGASKVKKRNKKQEKRVIFLSTKLPLITSSHLFWMLSVLQCYMGNVSH